MKTIEFRRRHGWVVAVILCAFLAAQSTANAGVSFIIDKETLDDLLAALVADRVEVPLSEEQSLTVLLEDLEITGLDPSAGDRRQGYILTSLKVRIPELGFEVAVDPRVSLNVARKENTTMLELRFEELILPLPLLGSINVAGLVRPITYNTDAIWLLDGARGDVPVSSSLKEVVMGRDAIRFLFDIEVLPLAGSGQ
jgi:hypothetical protein